MFQLLNDLGQPVVTADTDPQGSGRLVVGASNGEPKFYTGVTENGGVAHWKNDQGSIVTSIGSSSPIGSGSLLLFDRSGARAIAAAGQESGGGEIQLFNRAGDMVFTAADVADSGGLLTLYSQSGRRGVVAAARDSGGLLNLRNGMGNPMVVLGYEEDSRAGAISVLNQRGIQAVQIGVGKDQGGEMSVWDAEGRQRRAGLPHVRSLLDQP